MIDVTVILLIGAIALTVLRIYRPKKELDWLSFILALLAMCAVLIDETLEGYMMILTLMVSVFLTMMGGLAVMKKR